MLSRHLRLAQVVKRPLRAINQVSVARPTSAMLSCCSAEASTGAVAAAPVEAAAASSSPAARPSSLPAFLATGLFYPRDFPEKELKEVTVNGAPVVLGAYQGQLFALYGLCPHKQGQMALGDIEDSAKYLQAHGCSIKCPRHRKSYGAAGLNFSCSTGQVWKDGTPLKEYKPDWSLPVFDTRIDSASQEVLVSAEPKIGKLPEPEAEAESKEEKIAAAATGAGVAGGAAAAAGPAPLTLHASERHVAEDSLHWTPTIIESVSVVSHDSKIYRLRPAAADASSFFSSAGALSCDPFSWHVSVREPSSSPSSSSSEPLSREYTPVSDFAALQGKKQSPSSPSSAPSPYVDLLIKHYPAGKLTSQLNKLGAGASLQMSEPVTTLHTPHLLPYKLDTSITSPSSVAAVAGLAGVAAGTSSSSSSSSAPVASASAGASTSVVAPVNTAAPGALLLIAGGTGITPMLQILRWALAQGEAGPDSETASASSPHSYTSFYLLRSDHSPEDCLLAKEVEELAQRAGDRLQVLQTFTRSIAGCPSLPAAALTGPPGTVSAAHASLPNLKYCYGRISAGVLEAAGISSSSVSLQRILVSGPKGMFGSVKAALEAVGHKEQGEILVELEA